MTSDVFDYTEDYPVAIILYSSFRLMLFLKITVFIPQYCSPVKRLLYSIYSRGVQIGVP